MIDFWAECDDFPVRSPVGSDRDLLTNPRCRGGAEMLGSSHACCAPTTPYGAVDFCPSR